MQSTEQQHKEIIHSETDERDYIKILSSGSGEWKRYIVYSMTKIDGEHHQNTTKTFKTLKSAHKQAEKWLAA